MNNFYTYITEDIEIKKEMLLSMPLNTKSQQKAFYEKVVDIKNKYNNYHTNLNKYIEVKSHNIEVPTSDDKNNNGIKEVSLQIECLHNLEKILNPLNSYYEKLEFDSLLFEISNYGDFDFLTVNQVIDKLFSKFELINVKLSSNDFDVSSYVNEYMIEFIKAKLDGDNKFSEAEIVFERIYWVNPNLIPHIELNFRKLIKKYENKFKSKLIEMQDDAKTKTGIQTYEDCMKNLRASYNELNSLKGESCAEIINKAINKEIDINDYFSNSKAMELAENMLVIDKSVIEDQNRRNKFLLDIKGLKKISKEYQKYSEFEPFVTFAKEMYKTYKEERSIDSIEDDIEKLEIELEDINNVIFKPSEGKSKFKKAFGFMDKSKEEKPLKQLQSDSLIICDKLLKLYKDVDRLHFHNKSKTILDDYVTLDDFINLFKSYDFFKKQILRDTFKLKNYTEIVEYNEKFVIFSNNPNNVVVSSIPVFQEFNVIKVIINKYRINNININEDNLRSGGIDNLINNINLLLRSNIIAKSNIKVEQLWFKIEANKILKK